MDRREALRLGIGIGAVTSLGWRVPPTDGATGRHIVNRRIPKTGEPIPVVGLGTGSSFSRAARDRAGHATLEATLGAFTRSGGAFIDTAPNYGRAETVLATLTRRLRLRERILFATKVAGVDGRAAGVAQARESARLWAPKPVDVLQVHNLVDWRRQLPLLLDLKQEGLTRYVGVTGYRDEQYEELELVMSTRELDFVQFDYSIANRGVEDRLLPLAADRGIAVVTNMPFANARLFETVRDRSVPAWLADFGAETWAQLFLRWIVAHPTVTVAIPATANPRHVEDNVRAGSAPLPEPGQRDMMRHRYQEWVDA